MQLTGRTALVTGASSGLGEQFALALAARGARVVLGARRTDRLTAVVDRIAGAGGEAMAVPLDVADEVSLSAAFDQAEARFGLVDTLIANAGVSHDAPALEMTPEAFRQVMDVNVTGVFLTLREGARRLIAADQAGRGRAIIISSITASHVFPGLAAYSASKAAVQQMGRVLARDWARHGLCVNMLLPGYVRTEMNADFFASDPGEKLVRRFPRRRLLEADALLPVLLYLASDAAGAVTGASFTIDDGQTL